MPASCLSLAKQEQPDTSAYDDPEIVYRAKKTSSRRLDCSFKETGARGGIVNSYATRFAEDFVASCAA